ncbi:hypothetical protein NAEGRDRAFT_58872 [Naegleria gruberi]|uniref:Uncharacterized protein AM24 n=1 Tax=Naegleria gruberi TaxID=5762 RepID=D2VPV1_NAEGR|nr:uncharacterized protein NAEGRDRAFT_58872 [Naegleria gruberi]EFC41190.1 hypothetical protein NAEGRDRAFT_58872 [Naegleria gruberi]|eukprot:XP_002673934.1 hypothetical protein NAEGRDRAFT_58872 [Naegleria gruberi strain NEG-M]
MKRSTILSALIMMLLSFAVVMVCAGTLNNLADELLKNGNYVRMESERVNSRASKSIVPKGWRVVEGKFEDQHVHLTFALKNQNIEKLKDLLLKISDPKHPQHENYLTTEQVARMTTPTDEHKSIVLNYIKSIPGALLVKVSKHENFVSALMPLSSVNKYFKADMKKFTHEITGAVAFRSEQGYALPQKLAEAVNLVSGVYGFPTMNAKFDKKLESKSSQRVTPQFIWARYNVTFPSTVSPKSTQAVASFLQQYYSNADLQLFQNTFKLERQTPKVIGPNDESNPGVEASLDIQYLMGVGQKINTTFVSTEGVNPITHQERFVHWVIGQQELGDSSAWVHSVSYGDIEYQATVALADQLDAEFIKFGATGRTVLIASGDDGARCNDNGNAFEPEWPTSSPWITSVGATEPSDSDYETTTSWSGGGYSNYYDRPKYQDEAVKAYLASNAAPPTSYFNVSGRAYPDVAAFGVNYQVYVNGMIQNVAGTSASTPCFAGIVSLMNDARFRANKKPLGFLNIWLYQHAGKTSGAFYDIVKGNNAHGACQYGFSATNGWDPISGWGVPNYKILQHLALLK